MNIVKKLSVLILAFILLGGVAMAATVTLQPTTVPIGAYVNGSDGDQHFVQSLVFVWDVDDAWEDGDDIVITLPSSMTVGDPSGGGAYADEVSMAWTTAGAGDPGFTVTSDGTTITVTATTGANVVTGDALTVLFPVITDETVVDGTRETYSFAATAATDVNEASFSTITVTYEADVLTYVTFAANFSGGDQSTEKGNVYPTAVAAITAALPDIIVDQDAGGGGEGVVNGANNWDGITLNNDDDAAAGGTMADAETQYYVWACQDSTLLKIDEEAGGHTPIVYLAAGQPTRAGAIAATGGAGDPVDSDIETGTFSDAQFNAVLLEEGTWYFYVTSSVTADWVLGRSDSVAIRHWPVFDNSIAGYEAIVDFDGDGLFENNAAVGADGSVGGDDVTAMFLESGGGVAVDGDWNSTYNADNASFHYNVIDVDDNANIKIYKSTTDGLTTKAAILADANTSQISPDTLYEEGPSSVFWNYDIYTDEDTYEEAGDYYLYFVADDGKHSNVFQMVDAADADFQLKVKHYPNLVFQDVSYLHDENTGDADIDFSTANQRYVTFNWGETVDGDKDADGDMKIDLYISDFNQAASGYSSNVTTVDTTLLAADATDDPTHTVHVATITDVADGRDDNRYAYDLRNSGLAAGTYYMYAVITEKGDAQVVQMYNTVANDRPITLTHETYFLSSYPPEGEYVNLKSTDRFELKYTAVDEDATSTNFIVAAFMVAQGTATDFTDGAGGAAEVEADGLAAGSGWFWLTSSDGDDILAAANLPLGSEGKYTVDLGAIVQGMDGGAETPSGDYDVYYIYDTDGDMTGNDETIVQSDGYIHIESLADPNTSFEMSPNRFTVEKGDTVSIDIYATDGAVENAMILSVFLDVPTEKFSVVDQDNTLSGIQAWLDESTNFNGTEFLDTVRVNGSNYEIDYVEYASGGDAIATSLKVGTIQVVATANYTGDALEQHFITFSKTGDRETSIIGVNNNKLAVTVPVVAATVEFATPGTISGHVEIEGRPDAEGQTVQFWVVEEGSVNMISDSDFLTANGLTSVDDTLTITLGAGGYFEILRVPTGTYDVVCHKDGWLDERMNSQSVQPLSITNVDFEGDDKLLAGDCAGYTDADGNPLPDNQISTDDNNAVNTAFNSEPGDGNWNELCDFDGDSKVFITDLNFSTFNSGSGEGLLYKQGVFNGSNEGAKFELVKESNNLFAIKASELAHIRAYALEIAYNEHEWELKQINDGLSVYKSAYSFNIKNNNSVMLVSSIYGKGAITSSDLDLASFVLAPRVDNPVMPELIDVHIVDANFNETQGFVKATSLANVPEEFKLEKNYPNPFNPTTNIRFAIPEQGNVSLVVYDLLGNKIKTLVSSSMKAGFYNAAWNATNEAGLRVSSGVYFYRLMVGNRIVDTKKMVLMK